MIQLMSRIISKLDLICFRVFNSPFFKHLGRSASMQRPFRLDGSKNIELGANSIVLRGGWLYCQGIEGASASLKIGNGCVFGYNNHITSVRSVLIGNNVLTANNVYISDNFHSYENTELPIMHQPIQFKKMVVIGDGAWIGENACIIGATVGRNSVIGANAVVTRDIPDYSVAVGMPAVVIRQFDLKLKKWIEISPIPVEF